jgi:hypothetical protein
MKFVTFFTLFAVLFLAAGAINAQTKKRIAFKKNYAEISGTIRGAQTLDYVFRVRKNADIEIWVDHTDSATAAYPKFVLLNPNGRLFYEDGSVNYGGLSDMMDILPNAGDYTLRLLLPEEYRGEEKPVKFTLRLILK